MTHAVSLCLALLWNVTVQATAVLALAALVTLLSRRLPASFRHYVWVSCLLALPFLALPSLFVPSHPGMRVTLARPVPLPAAPMTSSMPPAAKDTSPAPLTAMRPGTASMRPGIPSLTRLLPAAFPDWQLSLCVLWMTGALISLGRLAAGLIGTRALMRMSIPVEDRPVAETAALLRLDATRVVLRQALAPETASVPMTWGAVRPVILFPADAGTWPHGRLYAALLHETAHVRRGDWLTQTLIRIVCAALWFHPGVWLAARACRAESERACDDFVLSAGVAAPDYARHLLDVARAANGRRLTGVVAMAQTTHIETRLKEILAPRRDRRPLTHRLWLGAFILSLVMIASAGCFVQVTGLSVGAALAAPNPDTVADASQTVTLANGVRVRLLAVTANANMKPTDLWRDAATGEPFAQTPAMKRLSPAAVHVKPDVPGKTRYVFAVQYDYDAAALPKTAWSQIPNWLGQWVQSGNPSGRFVRIDMARDLYYPVPAYTWQFNPSDHHDGPIYQSDEHHGAQTSSLTYLSESFPNASTSCTLKIGIAAGTAKTVSCKAVPGKTSVSDPAGPVMFTLIPNPHHLTDPSAIARGQAILQVTDYFQESDAERAGKFFSVQDHDRDILALDRAGRAVYDIRGSQVDYGGGDDRIKHEQLCHFPAAILPRIDRFELIDRPFQWATFPNVRLNPNEALPPIKTLSVTKTSTQLSVTFKPTHGSATTIESTELRHGPNGMWTFTNATLTRPDGSRVHAKSMTLVLKKAKDKTPIGSTTTVTTQGPADFSFHTDAIKNRIMTDVTITTTGPTTTTYSEGSPTPTIQGGAKTTIHCGTMTHGPNGSWLLTDVTIIHPDGSQTHANSMTVGGSGTSGLFGGDASKIGDAVGNAPAPR